MLPPLDHGIIHSRKTKYQSTLIQKLIAKIDNNEQPKVDAPFWNGKQWLWYDWGWTAKSGQNSNLANWKFQLWRLYNNNQGHLRLCTMWGCIVSSQKSWESSMKGILGGTTIMWCLGSAKTCVSCADISYECNHHPSWSFGKATWLTGFWKGLDSQGQIDGTLNCLMLYVYTGNTTWKALPCTMDSIVAKKVKDHDQWHLARTMVPDKLHWLITSNVADTRYISSKTVQCSLVSMGYGSQQPTSVFG